MGRRRKVGPTFLSVFFSFVCLLCFQGAAFPVLAQTDMKVDSSKPVTSPDGKRVVVIDRLSPVLDGEPERFSGKMVVRVTDAEGKSGAQQRYVEASQARQIQPPVWLDESKLCGYVYNIAKNSNGIVYYDAEKNLAWQIELVATSRKMASTGKVEQELTSLEVVEHGAAITRTRNVPHNGSSAFPIVLKKLPAFEGRPYPAEFARSVSGAMDAYQKFCKTNQVNALEPEQASESFSPDNSHLALLACDGAKAFVAIVPLVGESAEKTLGAAKLVPIAGVHLSCSHGRDGGAAQQDDSAGMNSRYTTSWKDANTILVEKEVYGAEDDASHRVPVYQITRDGKAAKLTEEAQQ